MKVFPAWVLGVMTLLSVYTVLGQGHKPKKPASPYKTGYQCLVEAEDYMPFKYTRSFSGADGVFVTTYKIMHPVKGTHAITVTATHYREDKKVMVETERTGGGIFAFMNKEETEYKETPTKSFGFGGAARVMIGDRIPNQREVQFVSDAAENIEIVSVLGSKTNGGGGEWYILDKRRKPL